MDTQEVDPSKKVNHECLRIAKLIYEGGKNHGIEGDRVDAVSGANLIHKFAKAYAREACKIQREICGDEAAQLTEFPTTLREACENAPEPDLK